MKKMIKSLDDINDLSVVIVNKMVEDGLLPDCTDTDDETEFEAQDIIREALVEFFFNHKIGERTARICDATGNPMTEGFVFADGEAYFAEKSDAEAYAKSIGFDSLDDAYEAEAYYYTEWEEDDYQYEWNGSEWMEIY